MGWRTVVVSNRAKLEYSMGYMTVRGEETKKLFMDEISTVIIESTAVALTAVWLNECVKRKIKVIFCDETRNPSAELMPCVGSFDSSRQIRLQIKWHPKLKERLWQKIVQEKIRQQQLLLCESAKFTEAELLQTYISQVECGDSTNREGHAAKVYFNALFGRDFSRRKDCYTNMALNYGYSILLSAFNREIVACGYLTQLGIFHDNIFNPFNLGCDLMEPFRPLVDRMVLQMGELMQFTTEEKRNLITISNIPVAIDNKNTTVANAISIYVHSFFDAVLEENTDKLKYYDVKA